MQDLPISSFLVCASKFATLGGMALSTAADMCLLKFSRYLRTRERERESVCVCVCVMQWKLRDDDDTAHSLVGVLQLVLR